MKVLVTGSASFIFSNFLRKAIYEKHPYTFVGVDNITKTNVMNNVYSNKGHVFYIGDVTDDHFMNVLFELERPDIVIHAAALTYVDDSITSPQPFIKNNVMGTQVVIDKCVKWGVKKLIYISTDEVYGHLATETEAPWTESAPMNPRNPYAASKAAGEMLVRAAYTTYGLQYNITRCSNNYGPRQTSEKLIPKCIKNYLSDKPIPVYGKGLQMREWTHVFDNCSAVLAILKNGVPNETYNISSNQEFFNIEVCYEIVKLINKEIGTDKDLITFVPDRPGHDFRYAVDSTKIRALGWTPSWKFKQGGLEQTCRWYIQNKWFLNL